MKASEIIEDAFREIGSVAAEQPIPAHKTATAIRYLNNLMYSKDHMGMSYTEVTSAGDTITTPAYTWMWMVKALAVKLAPVFGQLESYVALKEDESEAWSTVLFSLSRIGPPQLSGNVPYGSGNRQPGDYTKRFYTETDSGILTETNQEIVVEDDTE